MKRRIHDIQKLNLQNKEMLMVSRFAVEIGPRLSMRALGAISERPSYCCGILSALTQGMVWLG